MYNTKPFVIIKDEHKKLIQVLFSMEYQPGREGNVDSIGTQSFINTINHSLVTFIKLYWSPHFTTYKFNLRNQGVFLFIKIGLYINLLPESYPLKSLIVLNNLHMFIFYILSTHNLQIRFTFKWIITFYHIFQELGNLQ